MSSSRRALFGFAAAAAIGLPLVLSGVLHAQTAPLAAPRRLLGGQGVGA